MTKQEITEKVNALLVEEFEIAEELLTPEASLKEDLEIDSLVKTLGAFYDYIESHI